MLSRSSSYARESRPAYYRVLTSASSELRPLIDEDMYAHKDDTDLNQVGARPRPAVLDDPELEGLTLYEKKAHLVNRELNSHGMGRYQWSIWALCGLGYLVDLLYAQAFGLVEPAIQQEFGFGDNESGNLYSSFAAGLTAGAFVWGVLVDVIGRRWAFNLTVLIAAIFGLCLAAPSTYAGVLVLAAFVGFGIGGNIPIDTTICLEFLPQNKRLLLALLSIFQPLGVILCSGIAAGLIPKYSCGNDAQGNPLKACSAVAAGAACCTRESNMGWRYTLIVIGAMTLFIFVLRFFVFRFQESPKFHLYKGNDEQAVATLRYVAKYNGNRSNVTMAMFDALTNEHASVSSGDTTTSMLGDGPKQLQANVSDKMQMEMERYKMLFASPKMACFTILVWVIYAFDYWGFSIAGGLLPKILLAKNTAIDISVDETYRDYVLIYFPGVFGVLLGTLCYRVPRVGRKWAMISSSALMGVSLILFSTVNTHASNVGLNVMEYFFQSMFNAVLYGWTPEAFPAPVRGTACGIASFWGRLFSIIAPIIAANLLMDNVNAPLYLAGGGVFVCTLALLVMPYDSMGAPSY